MSGETEREWDAAMASALMTWVWIGLLLAQISNAESHLSAHEAYAGPADRFDEYERLFEVVPKAEAEGSFLSPVWRFVTGKKKKTNNPTHLFQC